MSNIYLKSMIFGLIATNKGVIQAEKLSDLIDVHGAKIGKIIEKAMYDNVIYHTENGYVLSEEGQKRIQLRQTLMEVVVRHENNKDLQVRKIAQLTQEHGKVVSEVLGKLVEDQIVCIPDLKKPYISIKSLVLETVINYRGEDQKNQFLFLTTKYHKTFYDTLKHLESIRKIYNKNNQWNITGILTPQKERDTSYSEMTDEQIKDNILDIVKSIPQAEDQISELNSFGEFLGIDINLFLKRLMRQEELFFATCNPLGGYVLPDAEMILAGDLVRLKSGSPLMTVTGFQTSCVATIAICSFFDENGVPHSLKYDVLALVKKEGGIKPSWAKPYMDVVNDPIGALEMFIEQGGLKINEVKHENSIPKDRGIGDNLIIDYGEK